MSQLAGKGCSEVCTSHLHLTRPCALLLPIKSQSWSLLSQVFTVLPVSLCPCCQYSLQSKHKFTALLLILLSAHIFIRSGIPRTFLFLKRFLQPRPMDNGSCHSYLPKKAFCKIHVWGVRWYQTLDWICKKDLCRHVDEGSCWQLGMAHAW